MKFKTKHSRIFNPQKGEVYYVEFLDISIQQNPHFPYVGNFEICSKSSPTYGHGIESYEGITLNGHGGRASGETNCIPLICFKRRVK